MHGLKTLSSKALYLVATLLNIGNIVGIIAGYFLATLWSQNKSFVISGGVLVLSFFIYIVAPIGTEMFEISLYEIFLGRFVAGLGCGIIMSITPLYSIDTAFANPTGKLEYLYGISRNLGVLFSYVLLDFTPYKFANFVFMLIAFFSFLSCLIIPESPYIKIRKVNLSEDQYVNLKTTKKKVKKFMVDVTNPLPIRAAFTEPTVRHAFTYIFILVIGVKFSGATPIRIFSHHLIIQTEGKISSKYSGLILALVAIFVQLLGIYLVDKYRRKTLFMISSLITSFALILLGWHFYFAEPDQILVLLALIMYAIGRAVGFGSVTGTYIWELIPPRALYLGLCYTALLHNIFVGITNLLYQILIEKYGIYSPMWTFACFSLIDAVVIWIFLPETKGLTPAQIEIIESDDITTTHIPKIL